MKNTIFDEQVAQAADNMLRAGQWPSGKPTPVYRHETEDYSALLYYSKDKSAWILKKTRKNLPKFANNTSVLTGSLHELSMELLNQQAQASIANFEIEDEEYRLETDPEYAACMDFLSNYREGQTYKEMLEYLSGPETEEMWDVLKRSIAARQWIMNANSIAAAFNELLDHHDRFGQLYDKAMQEKSFRETQARKEADAITLAQSRTVPVEQSTPFANSNVRTYQSKNVRSDEQQQEDAEVRKLSTADLKRKYLDSLQFGPGHRC